MSPLLLRLVASTISAVLGVALSALLVRDFHIEAGGFIAAVVVVAGANTALGSMSMRLHRRYAAVALTVIGLVATLLALLIAAVIPGGVAVMSFTTWILAGLIIWICMAVGSWVFTSVALRGRTGTTHR